MQRLPIDVYYPQLDRKIFGHKMRHGLHSSRKRAQNVVAGENGFLEQVLRWYGHGLALVALMVLGDEEEEQTGPALVDVVVQG